MTLGMMTDGPIPRNVSLALRFLREAQRHSLRNMADELNNTPGRKIAGKNRTRAVKFDHDTIDAIENQERLKIWQLGRYANWSGMPGGAIILFSQLASHLRDGAPEDVELTKSIAASVKEVCDFVIAHADRLAGEPPGGTSGARDRTLETLVRECSYKDANAEQKLDDARLIFALYHIMDRYAPEAKKLYRNHSRKRFPAGEPNGADV